MSNPLCFALFLPSLFLPLDPFSCLPVFLSHLGYSAGVDGRPRKCHAFSDMGTRTPIGATSGILSQPNLLIALMGIITLVSTIWWRMISWIWIKIYSCKHYASYDKHYAICTMQFVLCNTIIYWILCISVMQYTFCITNYTFCITNYTLCITCYSLCIKHYALELRIMRNSLCIICNMLCILHFA